ncbi:uncharacterized protein BDR25DRAFT_287236 [Lindgomyces ingoldianus]|uniref:Uncharacterized protein n=1 Tax=Lindgomyces ingoldianus TaxID=673940 RepID=A0ACB6QV11_9PLEO|nr:uncharacterized protein BDR25DRAFT_287236 [Lindgomyces ingoldianus]KAF2470350.1 hypothetical protein BDR25DRAFT_287236 [Lindgomyces ingoldianus]
MLAMERRHDLEQELLDSIERRRGPEGEPLAGLFALTREMETEDEDQFDVDMTILDFLAFKATDTVFQWRASSNPHQSDLPSALVTTTAEWRSLLKHKYEGRRLNGQTAFRSRLLQFVLLFTHRLNHDETWTTPQSLSEIRTQNRTRAVYWKQNTSHSPALRQPFDTFHEFPLSDGALAENRHELASALDMSHETRRWVTDLDGTPSLSCLLPLFIELTAARSSLGDFVPMSEWFQLTANFMLQAVLEEYLRNGASGEDEFNTIFAFGCPGTTEEPEDATDIKAMRKVFCRDDNSLEQVHGWSKWKRQYINELLPQPGSSTTFLQAMEGAQDRFPYLEFEANLLGFLQYLHNGLTKPDLVQVEEGRITIHGNELPESESREMFRRMGF